jgi:hypothetical protein
MVMVGPKLRQLFENTNDSLYIQSLFYMLVQDEVIDNYYEPT